MLHARLHWKLEFEGGIWRLNETRQVDVTAAQKGYGAKRIRRKNVAVVIIVVVVVVVVVVVAVVVAVAAAHLWNICGTASPANFRTYGKRENLKLYEELTASSYP